MKFQCVGREQYPWHDVKCKRCGKMMDCADVTIELFCEDIYLCKDCDKRVEVIKGEIREK